MSVGKVIDYKSEAFGYKFRLSMNDVSKRADVFNDVVRKLEQSQFDLEKHLHGSFEDEMKAIMDDVKSDKEQFNKELEEMKVEVAYHKTRVQQQSDLLDVYSEDVRSAEREIGVLKNFIKEVL